MSTKHPSIEEVREVRYLHVFVDLNGDGSNEAITYLLGSSWCGSGGCPTYVLSFSRGHWSFVSKIVATNPPIRVLTSVSNGWRRIAVRVRNPGLPAHEVELRFNGKTYAWGSMRPSVGSAPGEVVIPSLEGATPLYP